MARNDFVGHVSARAGIVTNPSPATASSVKESGFMTVSMSDVVGVSVAAEFAHEQ
jgi:hypothetical protein